MIIDTISLLVLIKWIYLGTFCLSWKLYIYIFWDVGQRKTTTWAWSFEKYTYLLFILFIINFKTETKKKKIKKKKKKKSIKSWPSCNQNVPKKYFCCLKLDLYF